MSKDETVSFPVRMPQALADKIKEACALTGLSQQDMLRLTLKIGLAHLRRIDHNLEGAILDKSDRARTDMIQSSILAGPPATYGKPKKKEA
jgi:hypothetical protein